MPEGPVDVAEVRERLGGAPAADDADIQGALDTAEAHVVPLLAEEWRDPETWPADLHDGVLLGAVLTYRNNESPTPAAAVDGSGAPIVPPIAWDRWTRARLGAYLTPGSWAQ
jgi:hypothetical protein